MKFEGLKNITLHQMEALIHLVEERNFSRAARKMFLTQPALTKHIQNAEEALGVKIVNRGGTGLSLTPEGKVLFETARKMIRLREEAKEKIVRSRGSESGNIAICASSIPATYILPRVLSGFRKSHPDIQVRMHTSDSEEALDMILNSEAEIGFIGKKPLNSKIHSEALWEDRLVLAVPAGHRWSKRTSIALEDLFGEPLVIRERGSGTRQVFESCLKSRGGRSSADLNIVAELGSSEAVKEAVIAGLGVSVLSAYAVARELEYGMMAGLSIRNCRIERSFYLIFRRRFDLMRHHQVFLDFIRHDKMEGTPARKV